jgi:hypothetical protein
VLLLPSSAVLKPCMLLVVVVVSVHMFRQGQAAGTLAYSWMSSSTWETLGYWSGTSSCTGAANHTRANKVTMRALLLLPSNVLNPCMCFWSLGKNCLLLLLLLRRCTHPSALL